MVVSYYILMIMIWMCKCRDRRFSVCCKGKINAFLWQVLICLYQDIWLSISSQERYDAHKCVIIETAKSPFSTLCISTTTWLICTTFMNFMPSIYTILHTKFGENLLSSLQDIWSFLFSTHFPLLLCTILNVILNWPKTTFSLINFLQI